MGNNRPTKEELKSRIEQSQKELEEIENNPPSPSPTPSEPAPSDEKPTASPSPSKSEDEDEDTPSASPSPSEEAPEDEEPSPSEEPEKKELKKKLSNSSRENQVLYSRTKKYDEAVERAEKIEPPTDEEMQTEYGKEEWDKMSAGQKKLAVNSWIANKRFEIMSEVSKEGKDIQQWNEKVDKFIDDPKTLIKHPLLEGKQEDFKAFAGKPTRRGLDFEDLVLAFKGDLADKPPTKHKGKMFHTGSGGSKEKPKAKNGKLSVEEGRKLRETDSRKWKAMLKAGKISVE